ncbi:hypothetical protein PIB30_048885 [Stylosanthes scabra]|uniref:F-box domain-containing protein n=1 Tax=Stylosanthes scabra TaxID=79078 RepID=A0ABU6RHI6_9FABA|nr:hypothetical protein [Stylosanthes scabra]
MDYLSGLPKHILHDILAKLPSKDAAKTIALSKAWKDTWFSFPYLSVDCGDFITKHDVPIKNSYRFSKIDILIDYVTKRMLRLCDQGLAIKQFLLDLKYSLHPPHGSQSHDVDHWIQMASENGVEVLELCLPISIGSIKEDIWYDLPLCVIEAKSLTELGLVGGIRVDKKNFNHSMKFSSVKLLSLGQVLFTHEGVIEHLISHCPLIEHLIVDYCCVYNHLSTEGPRVEMNCFLKSLFLNGLQKLKEVELRGIEETHIDLPNLENIWYSESKSDGFGLNFDSCTKLRCLCISYWSAPTIADKWFLELFSKYPLLESLELCDCSTSEKINIISSQLKVLKLQDCPNLIEVNIDAPNLLSFEYHGYKYRYYDYRNPVIYFSRDSNQLEVSVFTNLHFREFYTLSKFFENIPRKILASLSLFIDQLPNDRYLPALLVSSTPPAPSIKHLEFITPSVTNREAPFGPLMNFLFSSCFPRAISFRGCYRPYAFIEFFYEMLMGSRKGECFCSSGDRKCWWHALKIVRISYSCSFMVDENADFKGVLDELRRSGGMDSITFSLEL